jgi:hypothetical protein
MREILYLECGITFVASFIYIIFSHSIMDNHSAADFLQFMFGFSVKDPVQNINILRYVGWVFSTAMMICVLCLVLALNNNIVASTSTLVTVILLDWSMLLFGFLGETGMMDKSVAMALGFVPFFAMFYVVYETFLRGKTNSVNVLVFWIYFILWLIYGLVYMIDVTAKTITTNILDCIAKAFFAIGLSLYYLTL